MPANYFDFEKVMQQLTESVARLRVSGADRGPLFDQSLEQVQEKVNALETLSYSNLSPYMRVQMARHPQRPYPLDYVSRIFRDFTELHGDRRYADDPAIFCGFAHFDDLPVMVIGTRKGRELKDSLECHFGSANPEGYRKANRIMKLADKCGCPIITLVDTPGAYPGVEAEARHIGEAIAENLRDMFQLRVPFLSIITGEGGSGGALGLCLGNRVLIMANAYYSVITPEGCAAILWRSADKAPEAAEALHLTSEELLSLGIVDQVIPEPLGGAHRNWDAAAELLKDAIRANLQPLLKMTPEQIQQSRYEKFRKMGQWKLLND